MHACDPRLTSYPGLWLWVEGIHIYQLRPEDIPKPLDINETSVRIGLRTSAPITETRDLALFNLTIDSKLRG
jgi:hypothetical protein